ncbi:MAG TPA: phosphoesterase [Acidimicrobiia bacterium]|jgi:hypothetical protein
METEGDAVIGSKRFSVAARTLACGTAMAATMFAGGVPAHAAASPNLIKNGGAEAAAGGTGGTVNVPNWTRTMGKTFTAVKYGAAGGFPTTSSPGPSTRGKNFFAGGSDTKSTEIATQTISLASYATKIKGGAVTATAAGWFGGFSSQTDNASLVVQFKNSSGAVVATLTAGPVTAAQRKSVTGMLQRTVTHSVPKTATTAFVQLVLKRFDASYNDGYADNLSLNLNGV